LEIIDISGVQESPSREANVGVVESSSPHRFQPSSPVRVDQGPQDLVPHAQGTYMCC
jgi:hypothetical protein